MMATLPSNVPQRPSLSGAASALLRVGQRLAGGEAPAETVYGQAVRRTFAALAESSSPSLRSWRLEALARFDQLGFPTRRSEAWKAFNLRPLLSQAFQPSSSPLGLNPSSQTAHEKEQQRILSLLQKLKTPKDALRLVFVNGCYQAGLSTLGTNGEGLRVESVRDVLHSAPEWLLEHMTPDLAEEDDAFASLNAALFEDGACIRVPDGVAVAPLVHALFLTMAESASEPVSETEAPAAAYPRNVIALGQNARLSLLLQYVDLGREGASLAGQPFLTDSVNTVALAEGAHLDATLVLDEAGSSYHLAATRARLAESATLNLTTVTLGDGTCRHAIGAQLLGERASATLNGLDVLRDHGAAHHSILMGHQAPNGVSDQFYKGILDGAAQSAFSGMVFVACGANGTDSRQLNKNLLLSDDARVWTRPQLQINADDVKCAHGATVGSLEPDQLFYLASRGLDRALAQSVLTFGFAAEIIERIEHPGVRKALHERVLEALPGTCTSSSYAIPSGEH